MENVLEAVSWSA